MADVFISYSRKDIEFAQRLHHELEFRARDPVNLYRGTDLGIPTLFQRSQTVKSGLQEPPIKARGLA
ncbi:TPA: hypothetical protein EYO63_09730, partial [Candidatus Poribacteria bacterium]|nr:hypothetical protein [Candidatus Poribacteria bacterium]